MTEPAGTVADPFRITVPDDAWRHRGGNEDPGARLGATVAVTAHSPVEGKSTLYMHLEAWAVHVDEQDIQTTVDFDFDEDLAMLHAAVGAEGHFETLYVGGREYVVFASPFCA